jgi:hypothetical protein
LCASTRNTLVLPNKCQCSTMPMLCWMLLGTASVPH